MTIAFIINSYNRVELLKAALASVGAWYQPDEQTYRICFVVFDAGSTDGSLEYCESFNDPRFQLFLLKAENGSDSSFAAGLNAGVDYALANITDLCYLLFYETDNEILGPEPIRDAIICLESKQELAGCGFTVRKHDGSGAGIGMPFPKLLNFALGKNIVHYFNLEAIPYSWESVNNGIHFSYVDVVFTSPLMVKPSAWKQSGGLDAQQFPFSDTDIDWAHRLRNLGWQLGVVKTSEVVHDNSQQLSQWSKSRAMNFHRARLRYHLRYSGKWTFVAWPVFLLGRHLLEYIACCFVADGERRRHLRANFSLLISRCLNRYVQ